MLAIPQSLAAFLARAIAVVIAITVHEFAHAWSATKLGDDLPSRQGRVTLDPRAHLDPLGTLSFLIGFFGWGRPVQVRPWSLGGPRNHALVALAGPISNLIVAFLAALPFRLGLVEVGTMRPGGQLPALGDLLLTIILLNVALFVFNLIPLAPLDGATVILGFLPEPLAQPLRRLQQYGPIILFGLILLPFVLPGFNPLGWILGPIVSAIVGVLM